MKVHALIVYIYVIMVRAGVGLIVKGPVKASRTTPRPRFI